MRSSVVVGIAVLSIMGLFVSAFAADWWQEEQAAPASPTVQVQKGPDSSSKINWEEGYIEAVGSATVDMAKMVNAAQGELMACEGARAQAYARLAETVNGVAVTSETLVEKCLTTDQVTRTKVQAIIKGARVLEEKAEPTSSGAPKCRVRLGLVLKGEKGVQAPLVEWALNSEADKTALYSPSKEQLSTVANPDTGYTGIVIDTRGLGVKPAMAPSLVTEDEKLVYGLPLVKKGILMQGMVQRDELVGYITNLNTQKAQDRVGQNPLVIKAQGAFGSTGAGVKISTADALKILAANTAGGLLKMAKVLFMM